MTLAAVAPRIAKLLPMLGSPQAHEVSAGVSAINRTLASAGADLHDVANAFAAGVSQLPLGRGGQGRSSTPNPLWAALTYQEQVRWLDALDHSEGVLNGWERDFLDNLAKQLTKRRDFRVSDAQAAVIESMIAKAQRAGMKL